MKKHAKKAFLGTFLRILTIKLRFFLSGRALHQIYFMLTPKALGKKLKGSVTKSEYLKKYKLGPFGSAFGFITNRMNSSLQPEIYFLTNFSSYFFSDVISSR